MHRRSPIVLSPGDSGLALAIEKPLQRVRGWPTQVRTAGSPTAYVEPQGRDRLQLVPSEVKLADQHFVRCNAFLLQRYVQQSVVPLQCVVAGGAVHDKRPAFSLDQLAQVAAIGIGRIHTWRGISVLSTA